MSGESLALVVLMIVALGCTAAMAAVMNLVPGKPLSWDNYRSLQTDNTSGRNDLAAFGVEPKSIDLVVPDYLTGSTHQRHGLARHHFERDLL